MSVHRQDCPNYIKSEHDPEDADRCVRVAWANTEERSYSTAIHIIAQDRTGLVVDIATVLHALKIKMSAFNAREADDGLVFITVTAEVKGRDELVSAMAKLTTIPGVTDVRRGEQ